MTEWIIEAFREDTEELVWDLLLVGAGKEDLETALNISLLTPDSYAVTPGQVIAAVRVSSSGVSLDDVELDTERFAFFLSAVQGD